MRVHRRGPSRATPTRQFAIYDNPLPFDLSLAGVTAATQAVIFKPSGPELLNGIEIFVADH